jgi:hypothetical protein
MPIVPDWMDVRLDADLQALDRSMRVVCSERSSLLQRVGVITKRLYDPTSITLAPPA